MEITVTVGGRVHQRFMRTQGERDDLFMRATKEEPLAADGIGLSDGS
jgi:hypothetical protein